MTYDDIMQLEPTLSPNNSEMLFRALLTHDWRYYSSVVTPDIDVLIERFLKSHARMPGFVTDEILAVVPIEVFEWRTSAGVGTHGALFTNGAVVSIVGTHGQMVNMLFVDETTADRWRYPEGYLKYGERADEEFTERPIQT
jgi:hypothetical protein